MLSSALALSVILAPNPPPAKKPDLFTVRSIFSGSFNSSRPETGDWMPDGKSWLSVAQEGIVKIDAATGERKTLASRRSLKSAQPEGITLSADGKRALIFTNSRKVWRQNTRGDYWVLDLPTGKLTQIATAAPPSTLMFAKLSPDGTRVGYVRENNLYVQSLESGRTIQLTKDGSETTVNGTSDWVYEEELDLRDAWRWSPDGTRVAYWQFDTREEPVYTLINDTDGPYPTVHRFPFPMVGQKNATVRIGVVSIDGGGTKWMDPTVDAESGYLAKMGWAQDSRSLLIRKLNRKQNEDDYLLTDSVTGTCRSVFKDTDPAWVETGMNAIGEDGVYWLDGGKSFLTMSEKDGWRHLYRVSLDRGEPRLLTPGNFDVADVSGVDAAKGIVYYRASPTSAISRYLYRSNLEGEPQPSRVTPARILGTCGYEVSPDGTMAVRTHSRFGVPPDTALVSLPDDKVIRTLGDSSDLQKKLNGLGLGQTRFLTLKTADGQPMDCSLILPPNFDPHRRYPVLFNVYGEPWDTTVTDAWGGATYLFHQLIARKGYIVASIDNRGTPTLKGRAWRKSVYKKIGIIASDDQAAGAQQLAKLPYIDGSCMAVWGWSGGGSMTLNLLFRHSEIYKAGMAVASVPDMRLYDTIYQERYMGLLAENPEAYEAGSPITYAKNLRGALLIVHGSGDDNVHYQGAERLVNKLVELGKPFQMMTYPNRTHGIYEGPGTTFHLFELLLRFLTTNMPANQK